MSGYTNDGYRNDGYTNNTTGPGMNTQPTSGMRGGTNAGATTGRKLEGIMSGIHGAGEQIRGQFNMAVDTVMRDREGQARNQGIIDRGREEYNTGRVIDNPEKRRFSRETYPSTGGNTMAGTGTTGTGTTMGRGQTAGTGMGTTAGTGTNMGSAAANMPQSTRLTEGSYGEPGPTNAGRTHVTGGQAVGGGHYVDESGRRI